MIKKTIIFLAITSLCICAEHLPVVQFDVQIFNTEEAVKNVITQYHNYVKFTSDEIPEKVLNSYSKSATCEPFYNSMAEARDSHYSLSNPRLIEAILAEGYHLKSYLWIMGEEDTAFASFCCTLIGYDQKEQIFIGQLANGKETKFSYEYATKALQLGEIYNENPVQREWQYTVFSKEENSSEATRVILTGTSFSESCLQLKEKMGKNIECFSHIKPQITTLGREFEVSVKFRMEIKKKKLESKGCGGYIWWPVGSKEWDNIRWDEKKGRILYIDPTMPIDYPKYPSGNYFHNQQAPCTPCTSLFVAGVWVTVRIENNVISTRIIKKSTCNIGHGNLDKYGYPTAVIAGIVNIWVEK